MIICNFHIISIIVKPSEYDPPLAVDSETPPARHISHKFFKPVTRRYRKELRRWCRIDLIQQPHGFGVKLARKLSCMFAIAAIVNISGNFITEAFYHLCKLIRTRIHRISQQIITPLLSNQIKKGLAHFRTPILKSQQTTSPSSPASLNIV